METAYFVLGGASSAGSLIWTVLQIYGWLKRREKRQAAHRLIDLANEALRRKETHVHRPTAGTGPAVAVAANEMKNHAAHNRLLTQRIWERSKKYAAALRDRRKRNVSREFKALLDEIKRFLANLNGAQE